MPAATPIKRGKTGSRSLRKREAAAAKTGPFMPEYATVAALTTALPPATNKGRIVSVLNGASGSPCLAYCNGTNWLRVLLGAAVAAS